MKEHEIVSAVRKTTEFSNPEDAERAVRATLAVLGERLAGGETSDLASQLPPALAEALPATGLGERFGIDEFYQRVAEREGPGCTPDHARQHARAVAQVLKGSVTPGEFDEVATQLPKDYEDLLSTEPVQHH